MGRKVAPDGGHLRFWAILMDYKTILEKDDYLMIIYVVAAGLKSTSSEFQVN